MGFFHKRSVGNSSERLNCLNSFRIQTAFRTTMRSGMPPVVKTLKRNYIMRTDAGTFRYFQKNFLNGERHGRKDCFFGESHRTDEPGDAESCADECESSLDVVSARFHFPVFRRNDLLGILRQYGGECHRSRDYPSERRSPSDYRRRKREALPFEHSGRGRGYFRTDHRADLQSGDVVQRQKTGIGIQSATLGS